MEAGTLARVLHDFLTTVDGELSLTKGEHFLVHKVLDKHWCYGQSQDKIGKFPMNHLHKVEIPQIQDNQVLFVSTAAFIGEQAGDLSFSKGEVILGINEVGSGWYMGQIDFRKGIFPTTHAWQLDSTLLKKSNTKKFIKRKAKVKATLKAQLAEELDLTEGDLVTVTEILEDGWCYGETEDGRRGTFPEGFVSYIENDTAEQTDSSFATELQSVPISMSIQNTIYKDFGEKVSIPRIEEPAPSYYDLFPQSDSLPPEDSTNIQNNNSSNSFDIKPYAITLYPFNAQFPNELSFAAGQVVHLLKHIDSEWIEGTIEGAKGIFPASYVNIIMDCLEIKNDNLLSNHNAINVDGNMLEPGTVAKVMYTFQAQMDGDLSINEGEIVTVVEMANADWVNVKNKGGQIGLCPSGYLNPSKFVTESEQNLLEDFVVIRNDTESSIPCEDFKPKRLSEPHRPAPPAPAPGRIPLQKQIDINKDVSSTDCINQCVKSKVNNAADIGQKRADQRQNVISELVLTEKEYVRDLKLTYETFNLYNPNFLEDKGIDVITLFGNLLEVIHVAEELLDMILKAMKGCNEDSQRIGPCFITMADKLQTVYVKYCGNHEAALALLKKYENNEDIMSVFNKGIETLRYQIACFDMSSILIKPVQRILKYPLILYELIKCTEENHPDKLTLEEAWKTMTHVATYINEYKRRKDIVSKYLDNDNTLIRKMAKLSMHSVAKMSTRLSTRLSASLGLTNVAVDLQFEELERQFRSVEKCTCQLMKDVEQCIIYLNDEARSAEVISDFLLQYCQGTPNNEIRKLREVRSLIWSQFMQDLKFNLEKNVNEPISFLATLLEGPAVLITKRHDKLLDYDAAISKSEKYKESRIAQDELTTAKSNYEALNQQLIEELPILIDATTKVLFNCINFFANARKLLSGRITKHYLMLGENTPQVSSHDILESFLVNHSLLWNQITRFTFAGANPQTEAQHSNLCPQTERQKIQLKEKYSKEKLYVVTENIVSTSSLDMGAAIGTLVAIIKNQDPMGNTSRWFVDNGVTQGFLPSHVLKPLHSFYVTHQQHNSFHKLESVSQENMPDLISMDSPEKETKTVSESNLQTLLYLNIDNAVKTNPCYNNIEEISGVQHYQNLNYEFYYALYNFSGDMPGTLPIVKGQALKLLRPHDEKGNDEWWLMKDRDGHTGYVPQNYLGPPPSVKH